MSFMTVIDRKPLPASEKMFYLKNDLAGEALKAVEGLDTGQIWESVNHPESFP